MNAARYSLNGLLLVLIAGHACADEPRRQNESGKPQTAWDLSKFPKLTGKVAHFIGSEFGYVHPVVGEPFTLDFASIAKLRKLDFDAQRKSYIPLAESPLALESVNTFTTGAFASGRFVSKDRGGHSVKVDIQPKPGRGNPNFVEVWITIESQGLVLGVAVIDCVADGPFPQRPDIVAPNPK